MSSIETRLRKLEAADPNRAARLFVIEGDTPAERQGQIDELIRSGEARDTDSFIHTGVTRSAPEAGNWNEPNG
jgi:hypothetical protein